MKIASRRQQTINELQKNKITTQGVLANWSGLNDSYESSLKLKDID